MDVPLAVHLGDQLLVLDLVGRQSSTELVQQLRQLARRDEGACWRHATEEQRRQMVQEQARTITITRVSHELGAQADVGAPAHICGAPGSALPARATAAPIGQLTWLLSTVYCGPSQQPNFLTDFEF